MLCYTKLEHNWPTFWHWTLSFLVKKEEVYCNSNSTHLGLPSSGLRIQILFMWPYHQIVSSGQFFAGGLGQLLRPLLWPCNSSHRAEVNRCSAANTTMGSGGSRHVQRFTFIFVEVSQCTFQPDRQGRDCWPISFPLMWWNDSISWSGCLRLEGKKKSTPLWNLVDLSWNSYSTPD